MPKTDAYELEILRAFEEGRLQSVATKAELAKIKAAARAKPANLQANGQALIPNGCETPSCGRQNDAPGFQGLAENES